MLSARRFFDTAAVVVDCLLFVIGRSMTWILMIQCTTGGRGRGPGQNSWSIVQGEDDVTKLTTKLARLITMVKSLCALCLLLAVGDAFVNDASKGQTAAGRSIRDDSKLGFGIPSFLTPKDDKDKAASAKSTKESVVEKKKVGWKGLVQLITAGAGAPFLGDFEGVDKETGKFMFSLEANNLVDEKGNSKQTSMPYFENG
jgi:hypothetical protein